MDVQQLISLLVVTAAAGHLVWYGLRKIKRSRDGDFCGGCGSCGKPALETRSAPQATPLITLSAPPRPKRR